MINWVKSTAVPLVKRTFKSWSDDDCSRMAASLAYYAVFSIFPLILLMISALGYWLRFRSGSGIKEEDLVKQLLASVGSNISGDVKNALAEILKDIKVQAGVSGPIALVTTLLAASGIFVQLDKAFDNIWNVIPKQGSFLSSIKQTLFDRFKAFVLVLSIGALLIASLVVSSILTGIGKYATNLPAGTLGWQLLTLVVAFFLNVAVFALLFYAMPKPRMRWRDVLPAAIVTSVLWEVGKQLLSRFLGGNQYTASATIGAFIALLAWIYYASMIIFFGAEFAQVYTHWNEERRAAANPALIPLPASLDLPAVMLPDPQATASQKAAYATGGAVLGVFSALLLAAGGVLLGLVNLLRRRF
jgi:membrane protein